MAKAATKKTNSKKTGENFILSAYTNHVLERDNEPVSVFKFCKEENIKEEDFYKYFGSLHSLKKQVWSAFHANTINVLQNDNAYSNYNNREKMLSYYYTFFEVLKLNRSYVLFTLKSQHGLMLKSFKQLQGIRKLVKDYANALIDESNQKKKTRFTMHNSTIFSEGAWVHFLLILKYWIADESPDFEKTDVIIEKSVNTIFDVFETTPLESVIDLGKFLWREHIA